MLSSKQIKIRWRSSWWSFKLDSQWKMKRGVQLVLNLRLLMRKRELAESQLLVLQGEIKTLLSRVGSLEEEIRKEQVLSREAATNCRKLEDDILRMKHEVEIPNAEILKEDLKIKQDKELAVSASKLAECQKTIASLGQQLKSLATLEDFLIDSEKSSELPKDGSQFPEDGPESRKPHSGDLYLPMVL